MLNAGHAYMIQSFCKYLAGRAHVEAHEARTFFAKHRAVVQSQMGLVEQQIHEFFLA